MRLQSNILQDNEGNGGTTNNSDNQSEKTHYMSKSNQSERNKNSNIGLVQTESSTQILSSAHSDYIHHVSFDIYGRRMATCQWRLLRANLEFAS